MEPRIVREYDPTVFDELNEFQIARSILEQLGPAVTSLGDVICSHGLEEDVGASLLHKHFDLREGERVVRETSRGIATMRPHIIDGDARDNIIPYLWQFAEGRKGRHFYPLEFALYSSAEFRLAQEQMESISANTAFLGEFASLVWDLGLEDVFGIAALASRTGLETPSGHELLETTDSVNRVLTLEAVDASTLQDADTTETLWTFTPPSTRRRTGTASAREQMSSSKPSEGQLTS